MKIVPTLKWYMHHLLRQRVHVERHESRTTADAESLVRVGKKHSFDGSRALQKIVENSG